MAMRQVLAELAAAYEQQSGQRASVESVGGVDAARRIEAGEPFDFVVLAAQAIDRLADAGHVEPDTRTALAQSARRDRSACGSTDARPSATRRPYAMPCSPRAVSAYSTGPSGRHLARLLERWGIAECDRRRDSSRRRPASRWARYWRAATSTSAFSS